MATYFVASGGSNTAPYDTWAKAATSLQTALTAASAAGDIVVLQYDAVPTTDSSQAADTTYAFGSNRMSFICASNDGGSAYTPTAMGTGWTNFIGSSSASRTTFMSGGAGGVFVYGLSWRNAGSATEWFSSSQSDNGNFTYHNCNFWSGTTNTSGDCGVSVGLDSGTSNGSSVFIDCGFRFGAVQHTISLRSANAEFINCSILSAGSIPTNLVRFQTSGSNVVFTGCDLSYVTGTLIQGSSGTGGNGYVHFNNCKLGTGVTICSALSPTSKASPRVLVTNSSSADQHYHYSYYTGEGSVTAVTSPYVASGALYDGTNPVTWKITTTATASIESPFVTPWIDLYHSGTSAITPYLECIRDGNTTVYNDNEVWAEFSYQGNTGSTQSDLSSDRMAYFGSSAAQASSSATWTGATTPGKFKIDSGSAITPAEIGMLSVRIYAAIASKSDIFVDPYIRTA